MFENRKEMTNKHLISCTTSSISLSALQNQNYTHGKQLPKQNKITPLLQKTCLGCPKCRKSRKRRERAHLFITNAAYVKYALDM